MKGQKAAVVKITASKGKYDFETETAEIIESDEIYKKFPFYSYVYEQIEKIRGNENTTSTAVFAEHRRQVLYLL